MPAIKVLVQIFSKVTAGTILDLEIKWHILTMGNVNNGYSATRKISTLHF